MKEFDTDVLIVGSGLVGLVAAHSIASLNYKVTLVDKKKFLNSDSSAKTQGQLLFQKDLKIF